MNQDSSLSREPKTARGKRTREKLMQAAEAEFGEKGFHAVGIGDITRRAGVALGTFYVYFESKEEIFRALVAYMSHLTRRWIAERVADIPDRLTAERKGLEAFIAFVREHRGLYRIVSEAEFVANDAFHEHYETFAAGYREKMSEAGARGDIRAGDYDMWSWAIMGMAVFLGMRYAEWDDSVPASKVAETMADLIGNGIRPREG